MSAKNFLHDELYSQDQTGCFMGHDVQLCTSIWDHASNEKPVNKTNALALVSISLQNTNLSTEPMRRHHSGKKS